MNTLKERFHAQQERNLEQYSRWLPTWRTRRVRRRMVVGWLAGTMAMIAASTVAGDPDSTLLLVWLGLMLITVVFQLVNKVLTNNVGERPARLLDERELALRGRGSYVGFLIAVWGMVIVAVLLALTPLKELPFGPFVVIMSLAMLASGTPNALLCWQLADDEPDPIAEGDSRG
jgi:peptidoglycan/LPS O-acetylase OafA/YrhL